MSKALLFDDVALVGTGLSLLEPELVEFDLAFSPLVEDDDSLLDLKFRLSPGIVKAVFGLDLLERRRWVKDWMEPVV